MSADKKNILKMLIFLKTVVHSAKNKKMILEKLRMVSSDRS